MGQYTCPKCSGKNWKTKLKRRAWECRTCGYIKKEITQEEEDLLMDLEREKIIVEPKAVIPPKIKKEIECIHEWEPVSADGISTDYQCKKCGAYKTEKRKVAEEIKIKKPMNIFKSKTVWVIIALFVVNGIEGIREVISPTALPFIDAVLAVLAIIFRVKPKQKFE